MAAPTTPRPFRFRLVHLIYIVTLLAISMGTFGPLGFGYWIPFAVVWVFVFNSRSRPRTFLIAVLVMLLLGPCMWGPRHTDIGAARHMQCSNNLKQISLALLNYHQQYSCFPPAYIPDEKGRPQHSWRVLILPFLGYHSLYNAYRFDESWDGPDNRALLRERPPELLCPAHAHHVQHVDGCTSYMAVVGPATAWPGPDSKKKTDLRDPASDTILIVEAAGDDVPWTEPRDLVFPRALDQLTSDDPTQLGGHRYEGFFHVQFASRLVAMVDGSVHFVPCGVSQHVWSQLLCDCDGAKPLEDGLNIDVSSPRKLKIDNCVRLGVWMAVVLFPLPWVWLNRKPTEQMSVVGG